MLKIYTITFHHAYNFGSMLQTYALQEFVKKIALEKNETVDYEIINLYTPFQEELYAVLKQKINTKNIIKNIMTIPYFNKLKEKNIKFNLFLEENCKLTKRFKNKEELEIANLKADCFISGSDQIWNIRAHDFNFSYLFDFLDDNQYRISYAASMGPKMIDWEKYNKEKFEKYIKKFSYLSVREKNTYLMLKDNFLESSNVNVDPTLLLRKNDWLNVASDMNYNNGEYIFVYCLEPSKEQIKIIKNISKILNLPVVITKYYNKNDYFNSFIKMYNTGPQDFLSLINNAKLVLTSSFHGTVFSIIFQKKFFVFDGMKDNRISEILEKSHLQERSIDKKDYKKKILQDSKIDFLKSEEMIEEEQTRSMKYLIEALKI